MKFPVFDLHCDTSDALSGLGGSLPCELKRNNVHIDLERVDAFPGYAQCFACFTTPLERIDPVDSFEKKMNAIHRELYKNADKIAQVYSAAEIESNLRAGIASAIFTIEGPSGFGFDPALLEDLYSVGFRMSTLGWNESNPLTGSHMTGGGLTEQGRAYVKEAQRLGMLIDVSHISDEGFWDILDMTQAPIVASHSNSRAVCGVSRNLTDDMFRAICQTGGVVGINLYPDFLGEKANLDTVVDHILHFMESDPEGKHISLGGDLDGVERLPDGFAGIQDYAKLADRLLARGFDESLVYNIFWNNALEVFKTCCM